MSKERASRAPRARNSGREPVSGVALATADREAAREHWEGLSVDDRANALRFEDDLLVQRLHSVRQVLLDADLRCFAFGVRGQDAARREAGVDEFAIECEQTEAGELRPAALFAKRCFAERRDVFELLERRLGSPLLEGRPALQKKDWPSLMEQGANSWVEFMQKILRLVELSIFHAHCDAQSAAADALKGGDAAVPASDSAAAPGTQSLKRRQRKKRAGARAVVEDASGKDLELIQLPKEAMAECEDELLRKVSIGDDAVKKKAMAVCEDDLLRKVSFGDDAVKKKVYADWSVEIPCMSSLEAVAPEAAAEMFAWTRNTEVFDIAEGLLPEGHRAVVRNTFLDVIVCDHQPEQGHTRIRSRSL